MCDDDEDDERKLNLTTDVDKMEAVARWANELAGAMSRQRDLNMLMLVCFFHIYKEESQRTLEYVLKSQGKQIILILPNQEKTR